MIVMKVFNDDVCIISINDMMIEMKILLTDDISEKATFNRLMWWYDILMAM